MTLTERVYQRLEINWRRMKRAPDIRSALERFRNPRTMPARCSQRHFRLMKHVTPGCWYGRNVMATGPGVSQRKLDCL